MGLDISHGAFHGTYNSFHRFRTAVLKAVGGWFVVDAEDYYEWKANGFVPRAVQVLLNQPDDRGEIDSETAGQLADQLELLKPRIFANLKWYDPLIQEFKVDTFIEGCRKAAKAGEDLEFG